MVSTRRRATESSEMRGRLVVAAEEIIREDGFSALTSRTLAEKLGLKRQILHYYFKSMDELLIAVVRRSGEQHMARLRQAALAKEPLRAAWEVYSDPQQAALMLELNALANRRETVRDEVRRMVEEARDFMTQALARHLAERGIEAQISPEVATVLLTSLSQMLALEEAIAITKGHTATYYLVDMLLRLFAAGKTPDIRVAAS